MQMQSPPMGMKGHDHHQMMISDFRRRFYVVLALTAPIMLLSPMIQHFLGVHRAFSGSLKEKDIILVKPGEKVAADGVILEGERPVVWR